MRLGPRKIYEINKCTEFTNTIYKIKVGSFFICSKLTSIFFVSGSCTTAGLLASPASLILVSVVSEFASSDCKVKLGCSLVVHPYE